MEEAAHARPARDRISTSLSMSAPKGPGAGQDALLRDPEATRPPATEMSDRLS